MASRERQRRLLQGVLGALVLIPLSLGPLGTFAGLRGFYWSFGLPQPATLEPDLDSDFRFLAAVFLGIGIIVVWMIPRIEEHTALFRIVVMSVFLGGIGRLISWVVVGSPNILTQILIALELLLPTLIVWQARIAAGGAGRSRSTAIADGHASAPDAEGRR